MHIHLSKCVKDYTLYILYNVYIMHLNKGLEENDMGAILGVLVRADTVTR